MPQTYVYVGTEKMMIIVKRHITEIAIDGMETLTF